MFNFGRKGWSELEVIDVPLRSSNHEIRMSSFVDSISYIPLETKDECLIGFVDKIVATNDYYYVVDKQKTSSVLCFDKLGKFVRKIFEVRIRNLYQIWRIACRRICL